MRVYREQTEPLVEHYGEQGILVGIDAGAGIDEVQGEIASVLAEIEARVGGS
jgi:adenylate kinase family enzyme